MSKSKYFSCCFLHDITISWSESFIFPLVTDYHHQSFVPDVVGVEAVVTDDVVTSVTMGGISNKVISNDRGK